MKMTTHIRRFANTKLTKNVTKNTKKSANTMMLRSLTKKKSRFPRQFVIFQSTPVFLDIVLTQTFIPDSLDSVPQDTSPDTTPDTSLDTTLDTTQDTAVAILAARFVIFCFRIHNWISTIYLSIICHSLLRSVIHFLHRQREKGIGQKKANFNSRILKKN